MNLTVEVCCCATAAGDCQIAALGNNNRNSESRVPKILSVRDRKLVFTFVSKRLTASQTVYDYAGTAFVVIRANARVYVGSTMPTLTLFYAGRYHLRFRRWQETSPE